MIPSTEFIDKLNEKGFSFYTGVPCSLLSGLISCLEKSDKVSYIPSVREDAAVGLCAGAFMAGSLPVLLMQNSGFGYSLNAFTSLNLIYKIPALVIIMGDINEDLLRTSQMEFDILTEENQDQLLDQAMVTIKQGLPYTLLVKKGLFDERH
jgi:sulfopyruvate decarboxylase subunit alpha